MSKQDTVLVTMENIMVKTNDNGFVVTAEVEINEDEAVAGTLSPLVSFGSILRRLVEVESIFY